MTLPNGSWDHSGTFPVLTPPYDLLAILNGLIMSILPRVLRRAGFHFLASGHVLADQPMTNETTVGWHKTWLLDHAVTFGDITSPARWRSPVPSTPTSNGGGTVCPYT